MDISNNLDDFMLLISLTALFLSYKAYTYTRKTNYDQRITELRLRIVAMKNQTSFLLEMINSLAEQFPRSFGILNAQKNISSTNFQIRTLNTHIQKNHNRLKESDIYDVAVSLQEISDALEEHKRMIIALEAKTNEEDMPDECSFQKLIVHKDYEEVDMNKINKNSISNADTNDS